MSENRDDSDKLLCLANWFDRMQKRWFVRWLLGWSEKEDVQRDLRRMALKLRLLDEPGSKPGPYVVPRF